MTPIDIKDRKILYELDLDARQSFTQIGKKVGLKKDMVVYRVQRMQDEGIIKNFWTLIDAYKLGYNVFRFYLVFQYATPDIKNKVIEYLIKEKHTCVINSIIGRYDLVVFLWIKNINDFYHFWEKMLDNYGDYFAEKVFSLYVKWYTYRNSYLLLEETKDLDRLKYEITGGRAELVDIDETDYHLLNLIAENARIPLINLAEKLNCSSQTINYRLNNLTKSGVIQAFRIGIDISKFGLKHFKIDAHLKEHTQRNHITNYIKNNPYLTFIGTSAGVSDLELEFYLEDSDKLNQIMDDIHLKFPGAIRKYDYFTVAKNYKLRFIPEI
ncbi:MAG: Lrp/AsnC family transcriptional regulator [Euryarchaeota archaeon]|nr:Lrp/AsnC family transcriptional regulator [Euryarchaeota archaeon]